MQSNLDNEIAEVVKNTIVTFDRLVFPDKPIRDVKIFCQDLSGYVNGNIPFHYCYQPENLDRDSYSINSFRLRSWMEMRARITKHFACAVTSAGLLPLDQLPYFSVDDLVVAVGAHEVRHRLQTHNRIKMFTVDATCNSQSKTLWLLGMGISYEHEQLIKEGKMFGDPSREFDSRIVEYLVARANYLKQSEETIRQILLSNSETHIP
jgi:hypothetical protein